MTEVQKTLTVTLGDTVFQVADMSEQLKTAVSYMDDWRQKEADLMDQLVLVRSAIHDVQNSLSSALSTELKQQEELKQPEKTVPAAGQPIAKKRTKKS